MDEKFHLLLLFMSANFVESFPPREKLRFSVPVEAGLATLPVRVVVRLFLLDRRAVFIEVRIHTQ
jgi:hypothetical protein